MVLPLFPQPEQDKLRKQFSNVTKEEVGGVISNFGKSVEESFKQAEERGRRQGRMEGRLEGIAEVIKNILGNGMPEEEIARLTRIPLEQIREFKARKR